MTRKLLLSAILLFSVCLTYSQSDNCATATVVNLDATGNACVNGTTVNATTANVGYGTCNPLPNVNNEVWYTYVSNGANNVLDVIPQGMTNPEIVIYTGGCAGTLQTCNDLVGVGTLTTPWGIPAGTQVWIGIMSNQGTQGGFQFCISSTVPAAGGGNTCAGAIPLCDKNATTSVDMSTITPSGDWPDCFGGAMNSDVWFTFTCTQSGTLEFQALPTGAGANLVELDWALYDVTATGGCPNAIGNSAGDPSMSCNYNFDGGVGNPSGMGPPGTGEFNPAVNIVAGNTYVIVMDYFSGGGTGFMDFSFLPGMTAEIAPVADFSINPAGPVCAANLNVTITDNSTGVPTYDFGDGSPTYTGNNPPAHNYTTPGTYAITATIGGACPSTHTEFVQLFGPVVTVPTIVQETCPGDCDGSISLATTGGSGVYSYAWNPPAGQTTPMVSNLCAGNYSVTITDATCGPLVQPITINPSAACVSCVMDSMPVAMVNCYSTPFLGYDVAGTVYFTDPPTTGTLTITDCNGGSQVFNAPFGTSQVFNFTGLPQTGTNCAFTAVFSADPACTITTNFLSPPPITGFTLNQGNCINGFYYLNGTVSFNNPPGAGTLTVSYNDGASTIDTVINAPFTSPENWSITAPANGNPYTITVYFSGFPTCAVVTTGSAPQSCGCVANVGTFNTAITPNNGQNPYQLCFGDQFTLTSNGDNVDPDDIFSGPYNPGIGYLIYSCPPTIATVPSNTFPHDNITNDPCFVGVVGFGNSFNDVNNLGAPSYAGAWTNNTIYYVPITFYDTIGLLYSNVFAGNLPCYSMGQPYAVQYLTDITTVAVPDCQDSSVTVTVTGGLPEADGSLYTASNLLPANASFVNNTCTHGGNIVINGLQNGDMYSFDIVDANGCPSTVTGGPFVGLPNANAGVDDTSCTLTYNLNAIVSFGTGAWTGPAGVVFAPANSPNATVTVPAAGIYNFTWTEDNGGGCTSSDIITVTFNLLSIPNTPTNPLCNGGNDGQIILAPQGGVAPYTYQWDAAAGNQITNPATNLSAGTYTVTVTDAFGCFLDSTYILTEPIPFTYTTGTINANCGAADGEASVVGFAGGTAGYTYDWGAGPQPSNILTNLTPGPYTVTVADANGCDTTFTITVGNNAPFTALITGSTNASCNGVADGTATADGNPAAAYTYQWDAAAGNQVTQTATGLGAGTYTVTVTDPATGCIDDTTITITEPPALTVNAGTDVTICTGGNTNLSATGAGGAPGYTYAWDNGLGAGQNHNVSPAAQTTYIVTVTDANNCTAVDAVIVSVSPPLAVVASADDSICPGFPANISALATAGSGNGGPYTYTWSNGLGVGQNQTVSPATTTTYYVTVSDGCTSPDAVDSVTIYVKPLPNVDFLANMFSACEDPQEVFTFYNQTTPAGGILYWDFGDGSVSLAGDTVSHVYSNPGSYDVILSVTGLNGCRNSTTKPNYVTVHPNPTADFTSNPNPASMFDPSIDFFDQSYSNIVSWAWDIGGLDSSIIQNPTYLFPEDTGNYVVTLTVVDVNGCTATVSNIATVLGEFGIYVPNAFTPDGDGINDGFFPNGFGITQDDYTFMIFNRWGEVIYESYKTFEPWDGTYKGKLVQNGVYVWKLKFKDINGKSHNRIGHVTIVK